jgi:hypothetical protein
VVCARMMNAMMWDDDRLTAIGKTATDNRFDNHHWDIVVLPHGARYVQTVCGTILELWRPTAQLWRPTTHDWRKFGPIIDTGFSRNLRNHTQ